MPRRTVLAALVAVPLVALAAVAVVEWWPGSLPEPLPELPIPPPLVSMPPAVPSPDPAPPPCSNPPAEPIGAPSGPDAPGMPDAALLPACDPLAPGALSVEVAKPPACSFVSAAGERCKSQYHRTNKRRRKSSAPMIMNMIFLVMRIQGRL